MGLLVGNTTIIDRTGVIVEYSRTVSKNYQSKKASISFCIPKGMLVSDGYILAEGIVRARLGLRIDNPRTVNQLCMEVFDEPLESFVRRERDTTRDD